MKILKLILIFILICFNNIYAQETNNVTIEEAKEKSRGMIKELFEFRIFNDALEVRQLYDIHKTNTHNQPLQEKVIKFRDETNINFYVKAEIDYDHFWIWVSNNPTEKTPDGVMPEMLSAKYKVLFMPQWDVLQAPPKENRLYKINVGSELPESIINDISDEKFKEVTNSPFSDKTISLLESPSELVNKGLFNGFDYLSEKINEVEADLSKFSLILWGEDAIENNSNLFIWKKVSKEILLLAYKDDELYKIDWSYGENIFNNQKYLNFIINNTLFETNDIIDVNLSKNSTTRSYKFKNINIDETYIIEQTLTRLTSIREEFQKQKDQAILLFSENMDPIIINKDTKYLAEGMSKLFEEPPAELESDIDKILAKLYELDNIMQTTDNYDDIYNEIKSILEDENKTEFINQVINDIEFVDPTKTEDEILKNYSTQLETITMKKLNERIKSQE